MQRPEPLPSHRGEQIRNDGKPIVVPAFFPIVFGDTACQQPIVVPAQQLGFHSVSYVGFTPIVGRNEHVRQIVDSDAALVRFPIQNAESMGLGIARQVDVPHTEVAVNECEGLASRDPVEEQAGPDSDCSLTELPPFAGKLDPEIVGKDS